MNEIGHNSAAAQEVVDVEIATAGSRIAAYLLNVLFGILVSVPIFIAVALLLLKNGGRNLDSLNGVEWNMPLITGGVIVWLVYAVAQLWMMAKHGQSFGKRILKIRVLKSNGDNPGFLGTVLLREFLFSIIVGFASTILAYLLALAFRGNPAAADAAANLLPQLPWLVCLVMLFNKSKDRRTLQDMLADTVVVKLP